MLKTVSFLVGCTVFASRLVASSTDSTPNVGVTTETPRELLRLILPLELEFVRPGTVEFEGLDKEQARTVVAELDPFVWPGVEPGMYVVSQGRMLSSVEGVTRIDAVELVIPPDEPSRTRTEFWTPDAHVLIAAGVDEPAMIRQYNALTLDEQAQVLSMGRLPHQRDKARASYVDALNYIASVCEAESQRRPDEQPDGTARLDFERHGLETAWSAAGDLVRMSLRNPQGGHLVMRWEGHDRSSASALPIPSLERVWMTQESGLNADDSRRGVPDGVTLITSAKRSTSAASEKSAFDWRLHGSVAIDATTGQPYDAALISEQQRILRDELAKGAPAERATELQLFPDPLHSGGSTSAASWLRWLGMGMVAVAIAWAAIRFTIRKAT